MKSTQDNKKFRPRSTTLPLNANHRKLNMTPEQASQCAEKMLGYLRKCFPRLDDADRLDAVQTALAEFIAKGADFVPDRATLATYLCQAAFHVACHLWKKRERGWFQSLAVETEAATQDSAALSPLDANLREEAINAEINRRGRQQLLLSDIFEEYTQRCERQHMQTQREIYERRLRGQDVAQIESVLKMPRNNIDVHLKRARGWINERMQQADVDRSVFQTFLRPTRDVPALPESVPADVPRNFHEVLLRVINEAGALCPSDERLARYEQQPQAVEFSDLRYHIEAVPCELCQARRSL